MISISVHTILFIVAFALSYLLWDFVQDDDNQYCTVEIEHGRIRGKLNRTLFDGKFFASFRGIPFAKPPLGELRFKVCFQKKTQMVKYSINFSRTKFRCGAVVFFCPFFYRHLK